MASTGISEFTFGYAFLYEQTQKNWANLKAVPVLPSLKAEAELGWDAHLPTSAADYYYQFKLSDYLTRNNAAFISDGTYSGPYYRISLHRREQNRQHARLRRLCATRPHTYYVAPEFSTATEFESAYFSSSIINHSRLIPLVDCDDLPDSQQHYISFQTGSAGFNVHSQSKRHESSRLGKDIEALYRSAAPTFKPLTLAFAEEIYDSVRRTADDEATQVTDIPLQRAIAREPERNTSSLLLAAAELLSIYSGVTLVLVGPRDGDG